MSIYEKRPEQPLVELYHLRNFVELAKDLNLRLVADRLGISQPSLTRQVATLEEELGLDLLVRRRGRILSLTPAGQDYLTRTQTILRSVDHAADAARDIAAGKAGTLRLGVFDDALPEILCEAVSAFCSSEPKVRFHIIEIAPSRQADALRRNEIDLGITSFPIADQDLSVESLWDESWFVVLPGQHPLAHSDQVSCQDLATSDLILANSQDTTDRYASILSAFQSAGIQPKIIVYAQSSSTMAKLVASGIGIAFVTDSRHNLSLPGVICRPFISRPLKVSAIFRADDPSGVAMRFLRCIQASSQSANPGEPERHATVVLARAK